MLGNGDAVDMVVSDINMPRMDGLTLLQKIQEGDNPLSTVIVSAYGDMANIRTAMNRGAFDFLTKPIDFEDFEITIANALKHLEALKEAVRNRDQLALVQHELNTARTIQQSILPREFPTFPGSSTIDVAATMLPARSVGGYFYDYFLLDGERLGLVIGDVSGKGVPAALFMAQSRTAFKTTALRGGFPGDCLQEVNAFLHQENQFGMFVTLWYGVLHIASGEILYANAGHNPPYLCRRTGELVVLKGKGDGPPLGVLEGLVFGTDRSQFQPGDVLLLYTDGVTEAMNNNQQDFTPSRLSAILQKNRTLSASDLLQTVVAAVREFTAGAAQSDDLTILVVRRLEGA